MIKHYFENIEWYDYLIYIVYDIIFSYLLYRLGDAFLNINKKASLILVGIFQFYFLLIMGDSFFNFLPYLPDTELYSYMISSGQYPDTSSENILALYYMTIFIGIISLGDPVIYTIFCVFLYLTAAMIFIRAWKRYRPDFSVQAEVTAALLLFAWPAPMVYMTAPLREAFILFGFALFFSGFLIFLKENKWKSLIVGTLFICAIRLQLIVFTFPVIGALLVYKIKMHRAFKVGIIVTTLLIAFLAVRYILVEHPITPETMAQLRNLNLYNAGPLGYGNVDWHSYGDMARDYPFIILQFLFSPLPIFVQNDPTQTLIPLLDCIFMIVLLVMVIIHLKYYIKNSLPILLLLVFYIILFGGYEYQLSGAVRHRMPMEMILLLMAAPYISKIIFPRRNEKTEHTAIHA